jgi:hypothetical protein
MQLDEFAAAGTHLLRRELLPLELVPVQLLGLLAQELPAIVADPGRPRRYEWCCSRCSRRARRRARKHFGMQPALAGAVAVAASGRSRFPALGFVARKLPCAEPARHAATALHRYSRNSWNSRFSCSPSIRASSSMYGSRPLPASFSRNS